jgi:mannose-6-phosphate isomerase
MNLYPLKFSPIVKKMIWGSESWEITCRPNEMGIIENGEFAGTRFDEFISKNPAAILGTDFENPSQQENRHHEGAIPREIKNAFPLLVKIIDARDILSVQVHPDDSYAAKKSATDTGKSECWYILKPPTDGHLIVGLKNGVTREILAAAYENGTVENCLNRLKVQRGDIINIPAGLIHALTPGAVIAEIQQNSDITYRLYDFNRLGADGIPRPLHVEDALATINFENISSNIEHFSLEKKIISAPQKYFSDAKKFSIFTCVEGSVFFETREHTVELSETRSAFIPAGMGAFTIRPEKETAVLLLSAPNCPTPHIIQ